MLKHDRSTFFLLKSNLQIGTEHLILFGRQVFTDVFWFSKPMALLNYLCVSNISLAVQHRTPLEIRQKHSQILLYMHRFRIVSSVNSWVARLLCLPPTFRFVRLDVQRENHFDCTSNLTGQVPQWRKPKTDCHNKRKLVSDPMTVLNYKIDRGHPVLNDGPFITLAEVFTA